MVVAFFHTNFLYANYENPLFRWGYIAVEFFFMINGFYFAKQVMKEKYDKKTIGNETIRFSLKKIKSLVIPIVIIYIFNLIWIIIYENYNISEIVDSIWSLLLLRSIGVGKIRIMNQLWYILIMILILHILYPLLKKHKRNLINIASPIIIVMGLGFLSHNYGKLDISYLHWFYFFNPSIIRGLVDINIEFVIYLINRKMKNVDYTRFGKLLLTLFGEGLLIAVVLITTFIKNAYRYDFVMLLMIAIAISIIVSGKTLEFKLLTNRFTQYLQKISIYLFINHLTIIRYSMKVFEGMSLIKISIIAVLGSILFSIIEERTITLVIKKNFNIKRLFIKE